MKPRESTPIRKLTPNLIASAVRTSAWRNRIAWLLVIVGLTTWNSRAANAATVTVCPVGVSGTVSPSPGPHNYSMFQNVHISFTPAPCYRFLYWSSSGMVHVADSSDASTTMMVMGSGTVCPIVGKFSYNVTVCAPSNGTVSPSPGSHTYDCGDGPIAITATPAPCYKFKRWNSGGGIHVANPTAANTSMTVNADGTLCPEFEKITYTVTVCLTGWEGTVSPSPGNHTYDCGAGPIPITATVTDPCYRFKQWNTSGGVSVADSIDRTTTMTVTANGTLCPQFEKITYTITVHTPTGGTVSPSPGSRTYDCGAGPIPITATPASCYRFKEWQAGNGVTVADTTDHSTTMTVSAPPSPPTIPPRTGYLKAVFEEIQYTITVRTPTGGTVDPSPGDHTYDCGAGPISIHATPAGHYLFKEWDAGNGVTVANPTAANTTMTVSAPPGLPTIPPRKGYLEAVFEKKMVTVPNLFGMHESEIAAALSACGLCVGDKIYGPSYLEPGLVYSQNPTAGSSLWEGSEVTVGISLPGDPRPIYVDVDAKGANTGSDWTNAFTKLQDGLAAATAYRNLIYVAEGTYQPDLGRDQTLGDRKASFQLKDGVAILGGFAGFGRPDPDARDIIRYQTVLSGNIGDPADKADNSLHVVMAVNCDTSTVLDGLTVADGNANGADNPDNRGGGLFNNPASLKLIDCTFRDDTASWFGAGMYNSPGSHSEPNLVHCTFRNNTGLNGAAVYSHSTCNPVFTDCLFEGNSATAGGGAALTVYQSSATLTDCNFVDNNAKVGGAVYGSQADTQLIHCTFSGNTAIDNGGAVKDDKGKIRLTDCTFTENSSPRGGAIYCGNESQPTLTGCVFVGNTASVHGGAIFHSTAQTIMAGCTFLDNLATTNGGGMWIYNSDAWVINCTFAGNSALFAGGAGSHVSESEFMGCVFTGNAATNDGGGLAISNCKKPTYVTNCTFSRNSAVNRGGGIYDANSVATLSNSILWANTAAQGPQIALASAATMTVQRCDVQDGQAKAYVVASTLNWGTGNITTDPRLADADGADNLPGTEDDLLTLLTGSPCIDAGDNKQVPADAADLDNDTNTAERLPLDIAGHPRFVDIPASTNTGVADPPQYPAIVDMGTYERGI